MILDENSSIIDKDKQYLQKFKNKQFNKLISNNKLKDASEKVNKICIVTFDNRANIPYIATHNKNLLDYCKKYNCNYKFYDKCKHNVYWCKIHMVLNELATGNYDYVVWMDSDTYIFNMGINFSDILNWYSSDIFVGSDNHTTYDLINAGVFIIKNSSIGIKFLKECISYINPQCGSGSGTPEKSENKLKGNWAGTCYEQGVMNILIADKYSNNTTVLPNDIIYNFGKCRNNVFIMHLYNSSNDARDKCFIKK
jgi:hypothetical protein